MPIAILEIPKDSKIDILKAKGLCDSVGNYVHDELGVPDPNDKESRVSGEISGGTVLRIAFTKGPREYPDFKGQEAFFPTEEQIKSVGQSVLGMAKDSQLGVSQVVIEAWSNTTFILRAEEETPEPVSPVPEEVLKEIGSRLLNPRINLVLSPKKREGVSSLKESGPSSENENYREVTLEISKRMTEMLGLKEAIDAEIKFADGADTDVSVEFDCETKSGSSIPEEVRKYMAESVLHILDSSRSTKEGSGEVWIRQNKPETKVFI